MDGNYVKINRKILDWGWYSDINTCRLFIHMLLKANWKDGYFKGELIPRGSFVSSIVKLSEETNLTKDEIRTAIKHLISTKEITKQSFSKYSVFTVKNYDMYQCFPNQNPKQIPSKSQAIPKLFPTIEEGNKERREEIYSTIVAIPLKDGTEWQCPEDYYRELVSAYPKKDIASEFKKMRIWSLSNKGKRKTRSGVEKFVNNWLSGSVEKEKQKEKKQNKFNNFTERDYNMDDLERRLLQ